MKQEPQTTGRPCCPACKGTEIDWEDFLTPIDDPLETDVAKRCGICKKCKREVIAFFALRHLYTI